LRAPTGQESGDDQKRGRDRPGEAGRDDTGPLLRGVTTPEPACRPAGGRRISDPDPREFLADWSHFPDQPRRAPPSNP
jgi:hypothetical protein